MRRSWAGAYHTWGTGRLFRLLGGGGVSLPLHISPQPVEPQHAAGALQRQPGDPVYAEKAKRSTALKDPVLCWGGCNSTAYHNGRWIHRVTWR